jgi:hypothetical protein
MKIGGRDYDFTIAHRSGRSAEGCLLHIASHGLAHPRSGFPARMAPSGDRAHLCARTRLRRLLNLSVD